MASNSGQPPHRCVDYHVAWICPVANLELLPARLMLDEEHTPPPYDTHYDDNTYICGMINGHAAVVATCPQGETGNVNAGRLTGPMFRTFPNIRMALLVGIGGGIPRAIASDDPLDDIHLGDVVVGWPGDGKPACVYHDRGRARVDGEFEMVGTMQNPDWRLLNALSILVSDHEMGKTTFARQLERLRKHKKHRAFAHPGLEHDRLYKAAYLHVGGYGSKCATCDPNELVQRPARTEDDKDQLVFHLGRVATGNAVIQDGEQRDRIGARCDGALCVEMEAAGVDANRQCLVIRGISDYADSHKGDKWRSHAAGNAAAFARELLCKIQPAVVRDMKSVTEAPWAVPFARPPSFVGRETQLAKLDAHISSEGCRRLAIYGLGGCGKTALVLESTYRTREQQPARAIFWVPAVSRESFEQAYRDIGALLRIPEIADDNADVKRLVKAWLSNEGFGPWLMVVDNADDFGILRDAESGKTPLIDYLPHSNRKGSIVFTTRTREAAVDLAGSNSVELGELGEGEGKEVLRTRLLPDNQHLLEDGQVVYEFLNMLTFLALAIVQAAAFINKNNITLADYMSVYKDSEEDAIKLLSKEFEDHGRYRDARNPVATTWYISFKQIRKQDPLAADYLSFMACTTGENIPGSLLLPGSSRLAAMEAVGTLDAYAFVTERRQPLGRRDTQHPEKMFDMHRLVRLAMHNWLREHEQWDAWVNKILTRLVEVVPYGDHERREVWTAYLPHAMHVVELPEVYEVESRVSLLDRLGCCEQSLGRYNSAEMTQRKVLVLRENMLGKEHPATLTSMGNVALALSRQGKYWAEAEKMHREELALCEKVLGKGHPDTLTSMNNVAWTLSGQGKYVEAEKIHREELALCEKVLGKEHPDTLTSMNNVALALSGQGKYVEAEKMHREVLALREKVLGKGHPRTLTSMNEVAVALSGQGKYVEAEKIHQEVLALREKVLGKEHPDTLTSINNMALALSGQGKYAEAEKIHQEVLALREKVPGKEHPDTLTSTY
ncbi:kinesin light chain [Lindgomyces ingoldianus]|uniref:Kinesin light chain n=1 Tax=Lindgomyces ingoldianus TaxID=673940 RepID=A0ACB6R887_9PLEO|nr:kinesin light chain [Lindgomyces ingoldianus]KAF2475260.1 kinesin light chain [Lindgomyces ingoldianus]